MNLAKYALERGGSIRPLIIPSELTSGTGLMNPSVFVDGDKISLILRHVNYTFYHSEKKLFQHYWGPLTYVHPENDMHLRTTNYYCELDSDCNLKKYTKIDTSKFDNYEPLWDFVGLEDARLFRWDGKLYTCGVRRDLDTAGTARMDLCEIHVDQDLVVEISRFRIPAPGDNNTYCEKNWMPILDKPFHFVKWTNPTEIVKINPEDKSCETVYMSNEFYELKRDLRGGSQVIRIGKFYVACVHEVVFFDSSTGRKDAIYLHRFVVWDQDFKIVKLSQDFSFMGGDVEFCAGMSKYEDDILLTFGFQDNASYILRMSQKILEDFLNA